MIDWDRYPNFSEGEFRCRCGCGQTVMDTVFLARLQILRAACGFPFRITSGYRCRNHPAEKRKAFQVTTGEHVKGKAADINVYRGDLRTLLGKDQLNLFPRVGLKQRGDVDGRFIHLGIAKLEHGLPSPAVWTY